MSDEIVTETNKMSSDAVSEHLRAAQDGYQANDSTVVADECRAVLELEPENEQAWDLLAKFGGWDAKFFKMDVGFALEASEHVMGLLPESERVAEAAQIYDARKRQIAHMLDEAMLNITSKGASRIHEVMQDWLKLLDGIPYLSPDTIKGEVVLCKNLCNRSRIGIMPTDRMVYTAYKTHNGKETYGETFERVLTKRIDAAQAREEELRAQAKGRAASAIASAKAHLAEPAPDDEALRRDRADLQEALDAVIGFTQRSLYEGQIVELERQMAKTSKFIFTKQGQLKRRKADLEQQIARIDESIAGDTAPLEEQIAAIDERLGEADAS